MAASRAGVAARGAAARPGDHPLLHLTQRGLGRPCGAHADREGYRQVRPLAGGLDAWIGAGYEVEAEPLIAIRRAS